MKHLPAFFFRAVVTAAAVAAASCIDNDIPYPTVELNVLSVSGDGFTLRSIDAATRTVTLTLEEQTDIRNVRIDRVELSCTPHNTKLTAEDLQSQVRLSRSPEGTFDLRTPLEFTLSLYQDYTWRIVAEQTIEYRFGVAGQVGSALFDLDNRIATAFVAKEADRSQVTVTELKLGPANTEEYPDVTAYSETIEELSTLDYSAPEGSDDPTSGTPHFVEVTVHGRTERWTLYILPTDKSVELLAADAWSRVVWLRGSGIAGKEVGFRYRLADAGEEGEWLEVPDVTTEGGTFRARFSATEETAYQFKAYCADEETDPVSVTTDRVAQVPNSDLEAWCTLKNIIYPYAADDEPYWGSGNVGANMANAVLTDKIADPRPGSMGQYSAVLQSKYATLLGIGKFAAGNLFLGRYAYTDGTNGILTFGRSFTLRPTALRVWVKYKHGTINQLDTPKNQEVNVGDGLILHKGDPDNGIIYIALGTWTKEQYGIVPKEIDKVNGQQLGGTILGTDDSPLVITTRETARQLFRNDTKEVIGYGEYIMTKTIEEWSEVVIPINYRATDIRPTNIIIVSSASRWGDYFVGSTDSRMQLDDFELLYE